MIINGLMCWAIALMTLYAQNSGVFVSRDLKVSLFSEAPLENIEANSARGYGAINTNTGEIQFGVSIRSFEFHKKLMQEHFNENYMESGKYPSATFKGKLGQKIDTGQDGEYTVNATGELDVHGVKKARTISGKVRVLKGELFISSSFDVKCADHRIKIPSLVFKNIAETIKVSVSGNLKRPTN